MLPDILLQAQASKNPTHLLRHLGYELSTGTLANGGNVVARWRGFRVVCVESRAPIDGARSLARRLARVGDRAMAVAISDETLALAAPRLGTAGCTRVLPISLTHPSSFALAQLERLRPSPTANALAHMLTIIEVLSAEPAGERFFTEFRMTLERMAASVDRRRSLDDRRMLTLLALTRVLFLYFVQAKGWLAETPDYLRSLLDRTLADNGHFHRSALDPLFFGTLNCAHRSRTGNSDPRIPYLNGGLFEPHPVERRMGRVHFSNELWRTAFERLFDGFTFCVRESRAVDAIAPDMLGRVFERLMDGDERAHTGTFYTPESVVRVLVDTTLRAALEGVGQLPRAVAERLVAGRGVQDTRRAHVRETVRRLKVLDPAVGSGAFLLGALESLTVMNASLVEPGEPIDAPTMRREILKENLFGIDVNPVAVRLAELRLWLAVVADDPTTDIARITPLPNLDGVVRQGNSLLDPVSTSRLLLPALDGSVVRATRAVRRARHRIFEARSLATRRELALLHRAERRLAVTVLERVLQSANRRLAELRSVALGRDLFGVQSGLTPTQRALYQSLRQNRTVLKRALRSARNGTVPFFSFDVHVPDVMAEGGFHAVLGNPPWVRAERLSPDERQTLRARFSWWRASDTRGYGHLPDLAVAFLQRALELTAERGAVGFLLPSKLASAGYGQTMRHHLVRETTITNIYRVPDYEAARFGATTYPLAMVVRKSVAPPRHSVHLGPGPHESISQAALGITGPWVLVPDATRRALETFMSAGTALNEIATPALGVKTGADGLFVGAAVSHDDEHIRLRFANGETEIERKLVRPVVRGRDLRRFSASCPQVVLWGYDGAGKVCAELPPRASQYFAKHRKRLVARADYRRGPLWTVFRVRAALAPVRLVWPDIARRAVGAVLESCGAADAIPLNTCYVAPFAHRELALTAAAVLNSTWVSALVYATADEARGGYRRINARVAATIPIPTTGAGQRALSALSDRAHRGEHVSQSDLDDAVADALDLSASVRDRLRSLAHHYG
ncbi:MAG: N-6 DNA methylase [Gemmatimonadota bacterium]|nr:N-6 DNA methylase [Gemmatimonadota bacterium]